MNLGGPRGMEGETTPKVIGTCPKTLIQAPVTKNATTVESKGKRHQQVLSTFNQSESMEDDKEGNSC